MREYIFGTIGGMLVANKHFILLHLISYFAVAVILHFRFCKYGAQYHKDPNALLDYVESRMPAIVWWAMAWQVTLVFTPLFFRLLHTHRRTALWLSVASAAVPLAVLGIFAINIQLSVPPSYRTWYEPRIPSAFELHCHQVCTWNRSQPPHHQQYGTGCPC